MSSHSPSAPDKPSGPAPRKRRFLFVDDDVVLLRSLRRMLRATRHDWEITLAASGRQALMMLDALTIDVIVTDLDMPDLDGISLLEQCARRHPRVVRVVHSSHLETSEQTKVRRLAQLIVNKPARPAELIAVLERALDAGRSNDGNGTGGSEACG